MVMAELITFRRARGESDGGRLGQGGDAPRSARASGLVRMEPATLALIRDRGLAKGDVLEVARLAGIMAAKRTGDLIPLCHPLGLDARRARLHAGRRRGPCGSRRRSRSRAGPGVEMEALTAVSVAALTVYDMCKAVDRGMVIDQVRLEEKSGGRSGHFAATTA